MRKTIIIFSKQIHSCFAAVSSNDAFLSQEFETSYAPSFEGGKIDNIEAPGEEPITYLSFYADPKEECDIVRAGTKADETFYQKALQARRFVCSGYDKDPEYLALVESYIAKGWRKELNLETKVVMDRAYKYQSELSKERRKAEGFVIPEWNADLEPEHYRGALSNEVFNQPYLQDYLKNGGCHGYIGAPERKFTIDKAFELHCKKLGLTNEQVAVFCTHSSGRHFADQLQTEEDVSKYLREYLPADLSEN